MASKRRRRQKQQQQYQPRPPAKTAAADPQAVNQSAADDPAAPSPAMAPPPPAIPSTGMPISAPDPAGLTEDQGYRRGGTVRGDPDAAFQAWYNAQPSGDTGQYTPERYTDTFRGGPTSASPAQGNLPKPVPIASSTGYSHTDQEIEKDPYWSGPTKDSSGYARGGAVMPAMPGYSDFPSTRTDPVARRKYSPKHVGFAGGGEVDDPMDYIPDQPQGQRPRQSSFDELDTIGRQPPMINPALETGYAKGGPIAAAQVPAYTAPVYPAPTDANAKLYSDMTALRERTVNPPRLQMPALPASPPTASASAAAPDPAFQKYWDQELRKRTGAGYAEGGDVSQAGPDAGGYLRGDNAMDPQELDGVLQQIAQLDPNQSEDVVNLTAIVQAAQSGDMDRASSILAGFRRRFDSLNAHAQGAAAHGDMAAAAALAGKAHSQVPDGMTVNYAVSPDGNGVTATVSPSGQTFQMNGQQFHDYLVGPATSFDHILENGLEKNLAIASGGQSGQQAPVQNPAPTGYAEGGEVEERKPRASSPGSEPLTPNDADQWKRSWAGPPPLTPDAMKPRDLSEEDRTYKPHGYAEGGEVEDDSAQQFTADQERRRREEEAAYQSQGKYALEQTGNYQPQDYGGGATERTGLWKTRDDGSRQTVKDVLNHSRSLYDLTGKEDRPFSGANVAAARGDLERAIPGAASAPATGYYGTEAPEDVVPSPAEDKARTVAAAGDAASDRPLPEDKARTTASGALDAGDEDIGAGAGRMATGVVDAAAARTGAAAPATGYYGTEEPDIAGGRRTDVAGKPIGPALGERVPAAAAAAPPMRVNTRGQEIGGVSGRSGEPESASASAPVPRPQRALDPNDINVQRSLGLHGGTRIDAQMAARILKNRELDAAHNARMPEATEKIPSAYPNRGGTVPLKMYTEDGRVVEVQVPAYMDRTGLAGWSEGHTGAPTYYTETPEQRAGRPTLPARGFDEGAQRARNDALRQGVAAQPAAVGGGNAAPVAAAPRSPAVPGTVPDPGWTLPNGAPSPYPNTMDLGRATINARGKVTQGVPTYNPRPVQQNYEMIPDGNGAVRVPKGSTVDQGHYHLMPAEDPSLGQIAVPKNTGTAPGMKEVMKYDIQGNEVPMQMPSYWDPAKVRYENPYGRQSGRELYDRPPVAGQGGAAQGQGGAYTVDPDTGERVPAPAVPRNPNVRTVGATANQPATDEGTPGTTPRWQAPRGPNTAGMPPPDSDMSPAARAARDFPSTGDSAPIPAQYDKNGNMTHPPQPSLRQQAQTKYALEDEKQSTKDTPEAKMAREVLRTNVRRWNNMDNNARQKYAIDMHKTIADDNNFRLAHELVVKQGGIATGELLKDYRNSVMMNPKYVPSEDERGALMMAHDLVEQAKRAAGVAPVQATPPVAPSGATTTSPATTAPAATTTDPRSVKTGWTKTPNGNWANPAFPNQQFDGQGRPVQ